MSNNRHRSAPTSPIHNINSNNNSTSNSSSSSTSSFSNNLNRSSNTNSSNNNNNRNNNNTRKHKGLFGFGTGNGGGGGGGGNINFLDQVAQFSNSLHDIFPNSGLISDMGKMLYKSCNSCGNSFSIFVRKKRCDNCMLQFCGSCMEFNDILRVYHCKRCLVFNEFPLSKDALNTLRVRDLKWYLTTHHISSETYSEKRELIDLIIESVNPPMPTSQSTPISPSTTTNSGNSTSASAAASASSQLNQSIPNSTLFNNVQTNSETNHSNSNNAEEINVNSNSQSSTSTSIPLNQQQQQSYANVGSSAAASSYPSSSGTTGISHSHSHKPTLSSDLSASTTNLSTFNLTDINEESEIRNLSIRQLKLLLARNFVDFKGCVERDELINKAVLLWKDRQINKLKEENESEDCIIDENICKICMEHAIDCVLLECGHMLTCTNCGKILNECPVCRQFVSRVVHVFKA